MYDHLLKADCPEPSSPNQSLPMHWQLHAFLAHPGTQDHTLFQSLTPCIQSSRKFLLVMPLKSTSNHASHSHSPVYESHNHPSLKNWTISLTALPVSFLLLPHPQSSSQSVCMCSVTQMCPTLCDPMDVCSLPGSYVHGIFQARILEWVAISSSRGSSQPHYTN